MSVFRGKAAYTQFSRAMSGRLFPHTPHERPPALPQEQGTRFPHTR